MKKLILSTMMLFVAALGWSSGTEDPPPGWKPVPEQSQSQLAQQQRMAKTGGNVGEVKGTEERERVVKPPVSQKAASALAGIAHLVDQEEKSSQPSGKADAAPSGGRVFGWGAILLGAGLGVYVLTRALR